MKKKKNFWCFILLALLCGVIGLQEFYTNKTILGILAVIFSWTCIPAIVAFVEVIVWLFRGPEEFDFKYNGQ